MEILSFNSRNGFIHSLVLKEMHALLFFLSRHAAINFIFLWTVPKKKLVGFFLFTSLYFLEFNFYFYYYDYPQPLTLVLFHEI